MKKVLIKELDAPSDFGFFGFLVFLAAIVIPSAVEVNSVSRVVTIVVVPSSVIINLKNIKIIKSLCNTFNVVFRGLCSSLYHYRGSYRSLRRSFR